MKTTELLVDWFSTLNGQQIVLLFDGLNRLFLPTQKRVEDGKSPVALDQFLDFLIDWLDEYKDSRAVTRLLHVISVIDLLTSEVFIEKNMEKAFNLALSSMVKTKDKGAEKAVQSNLGTSTEQFRNLQQSWQTFRSSALNDSALCSFYFEAMPNY